MCIRDRYRRLFINDEVVFGEQDITITVNAEEIALEGKDYGEWREYILEGATKDWEIGSAEYTVDFAVSNLTAADVFATASAGTVVSVKLAPVIRSGAGQFVTEDTGSGGHYFSGSGLLRFEGFNSNYADLQTFNLSVRGSGELQLLQYP